MRDPWKYVAFPLAGITGYLVSLGVSSIALGSQLGVPDMVANILVIGLSGLFAGFLIDDLVPAYIDKTRSGGSGDIGGDSDIGGGDDDFDLGE
jgi:hypothetical protein